MAELINTSPVITIDGPAGSGKGTISQKVAEQLGWHILDSGALYRLVALAAQKKGVAFDKIDGATDADVDKKLTEVAEQLDVVFTPCKGGGVSVSLEGEDVSLAIRSEDCGCAASKVAAVKPVRSALLDRQRRFLDLPGLVADGRDMGTVVFPNAKVKIFLTASAEIRAERRLKQLKEQGIDANLRGLIKDIEERDARDMNRKEAPLVPADDAIIIDTGESTIDEVVLEVMNAVKRVYNQ